MKIGLVLCFTIICLASSEALWDQDLHVSGGDVFNAGGFTAYKKFTEKLEKLLAVKLKDSYSFIFRVAGRDTAEFLSHVTFERFVILQLFYSFSEKDIIYSNLLLNVANSTELLQASDSKNWIEENLHFDKAEIYNIIRYVAEGKANGLIDVTKSIVEQLLFMNNKYKIFELACSINDTKIIQWFLSSGFDLSSISWDVLEDAWKKGYSEVVKILLENNFINKVKVTKEEVNKTINKQKILHLVVKYGLIGCVDRLLSLGSDVNSPDADGKSPLYYAALANELGILKFLMINGANPEVVDRKTGDSLMHVAVLQNNFNLASSLLDMGAPTESLNKAGLSPLYKAVENDFIQLIYVLAFRGANVNFTNRAGDSLMHVACNVGSLDTIDALILLGSAVDRKNRIGETPLYVAAKKGNVELMKVLLNNGADIYTEDRRGRTLLQRAAINGDIVAASSLIECGAKINIIRSSGETALYNAAQEGQTHIVERLLMFGGDPNIPNQNGETPLHQAAKWGFEDVVEILLSNGANATAITSDGWSPLSLARSNGHKGVAEILTSELDPESVVGNVRALRENTREK